MDKKITKEEIQKLITIFKKMHFDNSVKMFRSSRKLLAPDSVRYDDGYNASFAELRDIINNLLMQYEEKKLNEKSFITYQEKSATNLTQLPLSLKDYLDLIKGSRNYFEYFSKLRDRKPYYHALYMPDELNDFCFKHIFSLFININLYFGNNAMNIKKIEYENSYLYAREPLEIEKLELLWKGGQYNRLIQECRNILTHVVGNHQKKFFKDGKKEQEIKKYLKEITSHYRIEKLDEVLSVIFEQFRIMRNKLGKEELGFESDRIWIEGFKNSPEINKKLYTRIIVDELKLLHNVLAILETKKINIESN